MLSKDQAIHKALDIIERFRRNERECWTIEDLDAINAALGDRQSVLQPWVQGLSLMQQGVLVAGIRGPDGVAKFHKAKPLMRWYRRCVLIICFDGSILTDPFTPGGGSFSGPSYALDNAREFELSYAIRHWEVRIAPAADDYIRSQDDLPHHFQMHFMHAAEIIGYKHPDDRIRTWWHALYVRLVHSMHLWPETPDQLDARLGDSIAGWQARSDHAAVCSD